MTGGMYLEGEGEARIRNLTSRRKEKDGRKKRNRRRTSSYIQYGVTTQSQLIP